MEFIKGLKSEQIEALADLWKDKNFKILKEVLEARIRTLATYNLKPFNWETTQDIRWEATSCLRPIKIVEQAFKKVNKIKEK